MIVFTKNYNRHLHVHQNPQKHGLIADFRDWPYSSYLMMLNEKPTRLDSSATLTWFDGRNGMVKYHQAITDFKGIAEVIIEDCA